YIGIFLFEGNILLVVIFFFLLILSTLYLLRSVFLIGYIAGAIVMYLNGILASETAQYLEDNLVMLLATYILAGLLCGILINLTTKQSQHTVSLLSQTEIIANREEATRENLEKNVSGIIQRIADVNRNVQENIRAQQELSIAINEVAAGSSEQNEKIMDIAQSAQGTLQQA